MIDRDIRDVMRQMSTENFAPGDLQRAQSAPRPVPCVDYYRGTRAHLSLDKDCSTPA